MVNNPVHINVVLKIGTVRRHKKNAQVDRIHSAANVLLMVEDMYQKFAHVQKVKNVEDRARSARRAIVAAALKHIVVLV